MDQDLTETTNLKSSEREKLADLKRVLDAWRIEVGAERMHPNPDYDPGSQASWKKKNKKTKARK